MHEDGIDRRMQQIERIGYVSQKPQEPGTMQRGAVWNYQVLEDEPDKEQGGGLHRVNQGVVQEKGGNLMMLQTVAKLNQNGQCDMTAKKDANVAQRRGVLDLGPRQ